MRLKSSESSDIISLSYNGEGKKSILKLNLEGKETLVTHALDKTYLMQGQWLTIHLKFDLIAKSVCFVIENQSKSAHFDQNFKRWKPIICFGKSDYVIDVPTFRLKDLIVKDHVTKYQFPLNESVGNTVHTNFKKKIGYVLNPFWLINTAYYWKSGSTYYSKSVAGSSFNGATHEVYFFNKDSITIFNVIKNSQKTLPYANPCPMTMRLGTNFLDIEHHKLYVYEVADPPNGDIVMASLDLTSLKWEAVTNQVLPMQLHHHAGCFNPATNEYLIFGGFGATYYFNNFYAFNLNINQWTQIDLKETDPITPRYFSSMGFDKSKSNIYIFGGMGNATGDQTIGRVYYYELYQINLKTNTLKKIWSIPWKNENFVPARNLIFTSDEDFYVLCYPEHFSVSHLKLFRFSTNNNAYKTYGDSIQIISEKITTNANLYYDTISSKLISLVQEFKNDDVASSLKIYSLSFPPVSISDLDVYSPTKLNKQMLLFGSSLCIILIVLILAYVFYKKKISKDLITQTNIQLGMDTTPSDEIAEIENPRQNAIFLFGKFAVYDQNGMEISNLFSPQLKHTFLLITFYSLPSKSINSKELSKFLWPDKSYEKAKNSRGVVINNLRKALNDILGVELTYEDGNYKIIFDERFYGDFLRLLELTENNLESDLSEFLSIISRGSFLYGENIDFLDEFKAYIESRIEYTLYYFIEKLYGQKQYNSVILLCEKLFELDSLDEKALIYIVKSMNKLSLHDEANQRYYQFIIEYKKTHNEKYPYSFHQIDVKE